MNSLLDAPVREELIKRVNSLSNHHKALWGKMNAYQMVKHCVQCDDMYHGKIVIKRAFVGRLIGRMILKQNLKDSTPFSKNSPTAPVLMTIAMTDAGDMENQKKEWIGRIEQYATYHNPGFVHPFFGPMTKEQVGIIAYKHADHHLRQFGA